MSRLDCRWLSLHKHITGLLPEPRGYHTLNLYENRIILIGGFDGRQALNDVHFLDLGSVSHLNIKITNPLEVLSGRCTYINHTSSRRNCMF